MPAMETPHPERTCEEEMRARIRSRGAITFAEFSEVALYWPVGGYYAGRGRIGPQGDFYTAPFTHPLFGALLAHQLLQMWGLMGSPTPFQVVELGAGSGRLAEDLLAHAKRLDSLFSGALRYLAVDIHPPAESSPAGVRWLRARGPALRGVRGCVLANELLDALPVHRVVVQGGRLCEVYVALGDGDAFVESVGPPSTEALEQRFADLGIRLPEGYRTEVNLGLAGWLREVAAALEEGYVLAADYGHEASTLYDASRSGGTLRCYYRHTLNANPYQRVGRQDISVHVDFTSLASLARAQGFEVMGFTTQAQFLTNLGLEGYRAALARRQDLPRSVRLGNLRAIDSLAEPEGMGEFKVLALGKGVSNTPLDGFTPLDSGRRSQVEEQAARPGPLATPDHMPLGGASPSGETMPTWEELLPGDASPEALPGDPKV